MGIRYPSAPSTPIIEQIFRKEEIFSGPYLNRAPDLVLHGLPGYDIKGSMSKESLLGKGKFTGMHTYPDAFLYLRGADLDDSHGIVDLAPSILHLLNIPLPSHFDSKPFSVLLQ
jgi:predicted AlkP superfamily phosphohydrolase/phosphomutase